MVFHVTNSGWSAIVSSSAFWSFVKKLLRLEFLLVALLASLIPLGVELALWALEELAVDGEAAKRRDTAAGLCVDSVVVGSVLYFFHNAST